LTVFENRMLRRIFVYKREEVAGGWRRLHNEEFYNLYTSPNIIRVNESRRLKWTGHVARMGQTRNAYDTLVGKAEETKSLRRPRTRREDNIRMDLREMWWEVFVDWMNLAQDRD
jgi:hypothetical protein